MDPTHDDTNAPGDPDGPLAGFRVLDLSRLAPGPFASMLLADMGADVVLVEPPAAAVPDLIPADDDQARERRRAYDPLRRGKRSIVVDLKTDEGVRIVHDLAREADVFLEGFRPGVTDRLGVGYAAVSETNPRIVYASISGYGQDGPYSARAGHDINYISIGGALGMIGRPDTKPAIPVNTLADFAGGGLMAAFAVTSALLARNRTGRGQHLDVAMSDGVLYLLAMQAGEVLRGAPPPRPGQYMLSGALPHYDVYECSDGRHLAIGALEPRFWAGLCRATGREDLADSRSDTESLEEMRAHLTEHFARKPRDEWVSELADADVCATPVLDLREALDDPHNRARRMVAELDDPTLGPVEQIGVGPKFSGTPTRARSTGPHPGDHTDEILGELGYDATRVAALRRAGAVS